MNCASMLKPKLYQSFKNTLTEAAIKVAPNRLAHFNNARLGFPQRVYHGAGGIGDDLLCTCVFRELKKRGEPNLVFRTMYPSLVQGNPDVDIIIRKKIPIFAGVMIYGLNFFQLTYFVPLKEHFLASMCRMAGVTGEVALRPYLFLRPNELAAGRLFARQIVIQSSGIGSAVPMKNKEWFPERFQAVANCLQSKAALIQLGTRLDPPLKGALDIRGKTSFLEAAAILANSLLFVGQVGFLMHLARAVDCRSVIVYGGREAPDKTGYIANRNLVGVTPCSPCWEENKCDHDRECMKLISPEAVLNAAIEQNDSYGSPLQTEVVKL
jgi:ADP-heptose:LPS heptosyltransferase